MNSKILHAIGCVGLMLFFVIEAKEKFIVGGWLPYWKTEAGIQSAKEHIDHFNELSPFSFEVDKKGNVIDKFAKRKQEWDDFFDHCVQKNLRLIPSIFWQDTQAIHDILSDKALRNEHISQLMNLIEAKNFKGLNLNYERVSDQDRDVFLDFIQELSKKLKAKKLELHYTIEGRTSDTTFHLRNEPEAHDSIGGASNPAKNLPNSRYKKVIAKCCDRVIIMAYDEWGLAYKYNAKNLKNKYYLSHSSKQWVDQIIKYMKTFLPAKKLVLGIPTYGLQFNITLTPNDLNFKKNSNPTFIRASEIAEENKCTPKRTEGGELSFTYQTKDGEIRYVCYIDSIFIKDRIALAKKRGLKGIYLFKIDGAEDKKMWPYLKTALKS